MKRRRDFFTMQSWWTLLTVAAVGAVVVAAAQNCSFDAEDDRLFCSFRTLTSPNGTTSMMPSATRARRLSVQCSDVFFYESILRTNHFGYLPNLQTLDLDSCKIRRIPALAFSGLSGLKELNVRTHNSDWSAMVMEVETDAFTGLNDLRSLNFTHNNLWTVPPAAFCGLNSLIVLNLSTNYLQDVSDLGFATTDLRGCRLPLEVLDLSENSLSQIGAGAFGQLAKLKNLRLDGNNLNVLEDKAFGGLHSLQSLNLANNQIVSLPPELFSDPSEALRELYLQNNSLSVLAPGLFSPLQHLLVLNLSRNELGNEWLTPDTFSTLNKLVALDLSFNRIAKVDRNLMDGLVSLQILNLKHNMIHTVESNAFSEQTNLHILLLSHNLLESVQPKSFSHLSALNSLSLDHNRLSNLHRHLLKNCSSLQDLALNNNNFKAVPKSIKALSLLRTLDLGENSINSIKNGSFEGLNNLYGLRMSGNAMSEIESSVFETIPSLQVLNLAHNELSKLDQSTFNSLLDLRMLRLDNNKLEDINGLLTSQTELRWLNISSNKLQWFDYAFIPKNLRWLDIHDNEIEELGNYYNLKGGFNLLTLDASKNRISKLIPISLPTSLEFVYLNDNAIKSIEANTFIEKPLLSRVELKNNRIEHLELSALAIASKPEGALPEFFISGNPFFCDCEMEWLQKINQMSQHRQYPRVMDLDNVRCKLNNRPAELELPITQIQKTDFLCPYQAHCFALCMCCAFFACDCRMQCPDGCSCFRDATWSANIIQCSHRGHVEIPHLLPMDATAIYLDGNNFTGILESQAFIGRKRVQQLYLNSSRLAAISNQTFNGLTELLVLHLEDNQIRRLEGYEFGNLTSLQKLFLQRNRLTYIDSATFGPLVSLEELYLHDNLLANYHVWQLSGAPALTSLTLSGNPWTCRCEFFNSFQEFLRGDNIIDVDKVECRSDGGSSLTVRHNTTCNDALAITLPSDHTLNHIIPIAVSVVALCVVVAVASIIIFVFRTPLKVWLHSKYGIRVLHGCGASSSKDKLYDAFVSYSVKDEDFVQQILAPQLEHEDPAYKLCLQHRDMPTHSSIADTLPGVSQLCSKHILVVSRSYIEQEWTQVKFALQDMKKKWKPIIILLEEPSILDLAAAPEFNLLLKTTVVVRWHETGFWNKLRYFLPDTSLLTYRRNIQSSSTPTTKRNWPQTTATAMTSQPAATTFDLNNANNSSSTSTRSTVTGGGSPRTLSSSDASSSSKCDNQFGQISSGQLHANPLDPLNQDQWSDRSDSAYSWQDHTYQTISGNHHGLRRGLLQHNEPQHQQHIYHTLESDEGRYDNLGSLDVMLPNGQMVPATLVRNPSGRIVPVVQMSRTNCPTPSMLSPASSVTTVTTMAATPKRTPQQSSQVTFPKTIVYKTTTTTPTRNGVGYLV